VHGDLYVRHVLIGDDRLPSAVIDWGDVHLGDPAVDLALAHNVLPPAAHAAFRAAYGAIDDETWHLAGLRALVHGLAVADFAIAIADADLQREALQALAWMAEAPG
jgi:aminoglycoside phosphotransferase (APT) family kinase protein